MKHIIQIKSHQLRERESNKAKWVKIMKEEEYWQNIPQVIIEELEKKNQQQCQRFFYFLFGIRQLRTTSTLNCVFYRDFTTTILYWKKKRKKIIMWTEWVKKGALNFIRLTNSMCLFKSGGWIHFVLLLLLCCMSTYIQNGMIFLLYC